MLRLRALAILLGIISLFLVSCSAGPQMRYCKPISDDQTMACYDVLKDISSDIKISETNGYKCRPIEDHRKFQDTCSTEGKCVKDLNLTLCTSRPQNGGMDCVNPLFRQPFDSASENYVCSPEVDFNTLVSFCEARC